MRTRRSLLAGAAAALAGFAPAREPWPLAASEIARWDREARRRFIPSSYGPALRDHADDALAHRWWEGNCVNLSNTALELMLRAAAPRWTLHRVQCVTRQQLHQVGLAVDDRGAHWVCGDALAGGIYRLASIAYDVVRITPF